MAIPPQVTVTGIQHVPQFDSNGNFVVVTRYTYKIGKFGPFTTDFPKGTDTEQDVEAYFVAKVAKYVNLGVIPPS